MGPGVFTSATHFVHGISTRVQVKTSFATLRAPCPRGVRNPGAVENNKMFDVSNHRTMCVLL